MFVFQGPGSMFGDSKNCTGYIRKVYTFPFSTMEAQPLAAGYIHTTLIDNQNDFLASSELNDLYIFER